MKLQVLKHAPGSSALDQFTNVVDSVNGHVTTDRHGQLDFRLLEQLRLLAAGQLVLRELEDHGVVCCRRLHDCLVDARLLMAVQAVLFGNELLRTHLAKWTLGIAGVPLNPRKLLFPCLEVFAPELIGPPRWHCGQVVDLGT